MTTSTSVPDDRSDWSTGNLNTLRDAIVELQGIANGGSLPPKSNRVWAIGDSITANDSAHPGGEMPVYFGTRSYLMWAQLASDSRIYAEDFAATGGYTSAQVLANHVPTVVAAKPAACVVLTGTNDVTTGAVMVPAATIANLTTIYTTLLAAGVIPILATIPPKNGYTSGPQSLNAWINRYARKNGLPLVDFYSLLADPATSSYLAAYDNGDGVHPSTLGAQLMGQTLATKLQSLFPTPPPVWLSGSNLDTASLIANSVLLTDSGGGVPTGWTASGSPTTGLAADAAIVGNAWTVTRTAADVIMQTGSLPASAGDRIACSLRVYLDTIPAAGSIYVATIDGGGNAYNAQPLRGFTLADANWRTLYWETVIPATRTNIRMRVLLNGAVGTKVRIAQPTMINLTANGLL